MTQPYNYGVQPSAARTAVLASGPRSAAAADAER